MLRPTYNKKPDTYTKHSLLFGYLTPLLMLFIPWPFMEKADYSDTMEAIYNYRLYSGLNFDARTETYMKSFGRFEIAIKFITFLFYLGFVYKLWEFGKQRKPLRFESLMKIQTPIRS